MDGDTPIDPDKALRPVKEVMAEALAEARGQKKPQDPGENVVDLDAARAKKAEKPSAKRAPRKKKDKADAPPPDDVPPPGGEGDYGGAPPPAEPSDNGRWPITVLGHDDERHYFLRMTGDLMALSNKQLGQYADQLHLWCGDEQDLIDRWQATTKIDGNIVPLNDWVVKKACKALIKASNRAGRYNLDGVRRTGIWRFEPKPGSGSVDDPHLVIHCGDELALWRPNTKGLRWRECGVVGAHVYIASDPRPKPAKRALTAEQGQTLKRHLKAWAFASPELGPVLLLGWIGVGVLAGAMAWRSGLYVTGQSGCGKSSLIKFMSALMGTGLQVIAKPSEASIRQSLNDRADAVLINEFEANEDPEKTKAVMELARVSIDGSGRITRAGVSYNMQAAFAFVGTLAPAMPEADVKRLTIVKLKPVVTLGCAMWEQADLERMIADLKSLAGPLKSRLIEHWPLFQVARLAFRQGLAKPYNGLKGHDSRAQDQLGNLLAASWVIQYDHPPTKEHVEDWVTELEPVETEETNDANACLRHLLTSKTSDWDHGARPTIAELVGYVMTDAGDFAKRAKDVLARMGLVLHPASDPTGLCVANSHAGTEQIFGGTKWEKGVHRQTLRNLDGAETQTVWMHGAKPRCTKIPITLVWVRADHTDTQATGSLV